MYYTHEAVESRRPSSESRMQETAVLVYRHPHPSFARVPHLPPRVLVYRHPPHPFVCPCTAPSPPPLVCSCIAPPPPPPPLVCSCTARTQPKTRSGNDNVYSFFTSCQLSRDSGLGALPAKTRRRRRDALLVQRVTRRACLAEAWCRDWCPDLLFASRVRIFSWSCMPPRGLVS